MTIHLHEGLLRAAAPRPAPRSPAGLPHQVGHRADHRLDRHPERPPGQAPLPRHRQEQRLAAQPGAALNLRTLLKAGLGRREGPGFGPTGQAPAGAPAAAPAAPGQALRKLPGPAAGGADPGNRGIGRRRARTGGRKAPADPGCSVGSQ